MQATSSVGTTINVLFLTADHMDADYIAYQMRKVAPHLKLDISPRVPHAINVLLPGCHNAVLIDHRISVADRFHLIAHIRQQKLDLPVILILGPESMNPSLETLQASADEFIIKSPSLADDLPAVIEQAIARRQAGVWRRELTSLPLVSAGPKPQDPIPAQPAHDPAPAAVGPGSSKGDVSDRRSSPRFEVNIPCRVEWHKNLHNAVLHDLSMEGAFVESSISASAGSEIAIYREADAKPFRVGATITHRGWYLTEFQNFEGFGVRFCNLTAEITTTLQETCRKSSKPATAKTTLEH